MNNPDDPIRDFFESEWTVNQESAPDFAAAVLKKIAAGKRQERLFYLACIAMALAGAAAIVIFVYPGYRQLPAVIDGIGAFAAGLVKSLQGQPESSFISIPLLLYICVLTAVLSGLDYLLKRRRHVQTAG